MKKWYLKLNADNIIQDIIEYAYGDYIEVETEQTSLPVGINGGWHRWNGTAFQEDLSLKPIDAATEIENLKAENASLKSKIYKNEKITAENGISQQDLLDLLITLEVI